MKSLTELSKTEKLVSDKALYGYSRHELAEIFGCKADQISRMLGSVYMKLGVKNRDQFMAHRIAYLEDMLHSNGIYYE